MFNTDYEIARKKAQSLADTTRLLLRLKKVGGPLEQGYRWGFVPSEDKQFGRDLEGELIRPS